MSLIRSGELRAQVVLYYWRNRRWVVVGYRVRVSYMRVRLVGSAYLQPFWRNEAQGYYQTLERQL